MVLIRPHPFDAPYFGVWPCMMLSLYFQTFKLFLRYSSLEESWWGTVVVFFFLSSSLCSNHSVQRDFSFQAPGTELGLIVKAQCCELLKTYISMGALRLTAQKLCHLGNVQWTSPEWLISVQNISQGDIAFYAVSLGAPLETTAQCRSKAAYSA